MVFATVLRWWGKSRLDWKSGGKGSGHSEYRQFGENFFNKEEQKNKVMAKGECLVQKRCFFKIGDTTKYLIANRKE